LKKWPRVKKKKGKAPLLAWTYKQAPSKGPPPKTERENRKLGTRPTRGGGEKRKREEKNPHLKRVF